MDDTRLTEVEIRYTYLEQLVTDLSQVIHAQQQTIATLTSRLERVEQLIAEAMQQPSDRLPHEKPPHY
ncbi:MAG: SlyX family protein [Polyangiaceae bacterium]